MPSCRRACACASERPAVLALGVVGSPTDSWTTLHSEESARDTKRNDRETHDMISYHIISYHIILYYIILYYVMLYCTILYCIMWCYIDSYYIILYDVLVSDMVVECDMPLRYMFTVLWHDMIQHVMLLCMMLFYIIQGQNVPPLPVTALLLNRL